MSSPHPNADVRMRGFAQRAPFEDARGWLDAILDQLGPLSSQVVSLPDAAGRVLAQNIVSLVNVPDFPRAMMDGYALHTSDIAQATAEHPVQLKILGECLPGQVFVPTVEAGQAVRIMTGAPLPAGVDGVLPVEQTQAVDDAVAALCPLAAGKNFGQVGEDICKGDAVLSAGRVLRPQDIGLLSSIGQGQVAVVRKPRVNIVVTGSELLPAGEKPSGCQIVDANGPMLTSLIQRDGGLPNHLGIIPDDRASILSALSEDADITVASGGSSVGQEDHVPTLLAEHGKLVIHGVAMRPAAPLGMGKLNSRLVFLLPGNPVASLCGYDLFAGRAVRSLGGISRSLPHQKTRALLAREIVSPVGRCDYVRAEMIEGALHPLVGCGASVLSSTCRATGFVVVPSQSAGYSANTEVEVYLYD